MFFSRQHVIIFLSRTVVLLSTYLSTVGGLCPDISDECWGLSDDRSCELSRETDITKCCHEKGIFPHSRKNKLYFYCEGPGLKPCTCLCPSSNDYLETQNSACAEGGSVETEHGDNLDRNSKVDTGRPNTFNEINKDSLRKHLNSSYDTGDSNLNFIPMVTNQSLTNQTQHLAQAEALTELRDDPSFPVWAITFIVLCVVCATVGAIMYLY